MTDPSGQLAGIVADPDDWQRRLVYADWLDDNDEPAKAEFTRLQVELAGRPRFKEDYPNCTACDGDGLSTGPPESRPCRRCQGTGKRNYDLYRETQRMVVREAELLGAHETAWRSSRPCEACNGVGRVRGMDRCRGCDGSGDLGGLLRGFTYEDIETLRGRSRGLRTTIGEIVRIDWSRHPLLTLRVPRLGDCVEEYQKSCDRCQGAGEVPVYIGDGDHRMDDCWDCAGAGERAVLAPTRWLRAVVAHHQVIGVEPLNKCPSRDSALLAPHGETFDWYDGSARGNANDSDDLPSELFRRVSGWANYHMNRGYCEFASREAAVAALGRELALWARECDSVPS